MGGIIHAYYDCVSPYSYFAFIQLKRLRDILASHGVNIEIHPIFLGGVMAGSGNKPPWTVPAKGKMSKFETKRAMGYLKIKPFEMPKSFPIMTILPQRTLTYIKHVYPQNQFERIVELYWEWFFYQHQDISKPDVLRQLLATPETGFTAEEAEAIMSAATEQKWKDALTAKTQEALDRGAFGAPFFWVVKLDEQGNVLKEEPFFGSDRFHQMWDYLDLPYNDIKVLERDGAKL